MTPATIKRKFTQLRVKILQGVTQKTEGLFGIDDELDDCVIGCSYAGGKPLYTGKAAFKSKNGEFLLIFNQEFWIPVQKPVTNDRFVLEVLEKGVVSDTLLGSIVMNTQQLISLGDNEGHFMW